MFISIYIFTFLDTNTFSCRPTIIQVTAAVAPATTGATRITATGSDFGTSLYTQVRLVPICIMFSCSCLSSFVNIHMHVASCKNVL
jgi:hypothetical protein